MAEPTYENAIAAMRKAHEAGDVEAARRMARLAKSLQGQQQEAPDRNKGFLAQANRQIAGAIDFVNPFDDPVWGEIAGGRFQTPSAGEAFRSVGIGTAEGEPETFVEGLGAGTGNAAVALIPTVKGLQALRGMGGAIGAAADDAYLALTTKLGVGTELAAGALGGGAREVAEEAGAPEWVQDVAEFAAPAVGIPAAAGGVKALTGAATGVASRLPVTGAAIRGAKSVARSIAPMTDVGARQVAREELIRRAGTEERLVEMGEAIDPKDPLGRTPAQQTGDPEMMALEEAAKRERPEIRPRIEERAEESRVRAKAAVEAEGGNIKDAREFFRGRLNEYRQNLQNKIDETLRMASESVEGVGPRQSESGASMGAVEKIRMELGNQLEQERALWAAVPKEAMVPTENAAGIAQSLIDETPWALRRDIPADIREAFGANGTLGPETTVNELHGLYSALRQVSREARSGAAPNNNRARIADAVAEAILEDLGAVSGDTPAGRAINEARAFSRALHETFDTGAVGRILKTTQAGDTTVAPETALRRTIGRGGSDAVADEASIRAAAPGATEDIADFSRGRFMDALIDPQGKFTPQRARTWLRNNREMLRKYPGMLAEFNRALSSRETAERFAARASVRMDLAGKGTIAGFNSGQTDQAVGAILGADDPIKAAQIITRAARKDPTGAAMAGVKGAFTDYLIGRSTGADQVLSGKGLLSLLRDPKVAPAMRQVFSAAELQRLKRIASAVADMEVKPSEVGEVINAPSNALLERAVQIFAAQQGGKFGAGAGMGGSLQTANIFQSTARKWLSNLTNDRARQLLIDAVEDPELMRVLMLEPRGEMPDWARNKLAPYFVGGAAQVEEDNQ